jgi:hypothetical protein
MKKVFFFDLSLSLSLFFSVVRKTSCRFQEKLARERGRDETNVAAAASSCEKRGEKFDQILVFFVFSPFPFLILKKLGFLPLRKKFTSSLFWLISSRSQNVGGAIGKRKRERKARETSAPLFRPTTCDPISLSLSLPFSTPQKTND